MKNNKLSKTVVMFMVAIAALLTMALVSACSSNENNVEEHSVSECDLCGCEGKCMERLEELESRVSVLESQLNDMKTTTTTTTTTTEAEEETTTVATTGTKKPNSNNGGGNKTTKATTKATTQATTKATTAATTKAPDNDNLGEWTEGWD